MMLLASVSTHMHAHISTHAPDHTHAHMSFSACTRRLRTCVELLLPSLCHTLCLICQALRVVYGTPDAEAIALEQQRLLQQQEPPGQQQHQPRQQRLHQRRRRPVPVELPGFSPRRSAEADERAKAAIRPAVSPGAASGMPDWGPPPGWVTVNAGGCMATYASSGAPPCTASSVCVMRIQMWQMDERC